MGVGNGEHNRDSIKEYHGIGKAEVTDGRD